MKWLKKAFDNIWAILAFVGGGLFVYFRHKAESEKERRVLAEAKLQMKNAVAASDIAIDGQLKKIIEEELGDKTNLTDVANKRFSRGVLRKAKVRGGGRPRRPS